MAHLTVCSHFLVSSFHCTPLVCVVTQTLQSHTWKDLTPLAFRNFLIPALLPAKMICRLQDRLTVKDRPTHPHSWPAIGKFQVNN